MVFWKLTPVDSSWCENSGYSDRIDFILSLTIHSLYIIGFLENFHLGFSFVIQWHSVSMEMWWSLPTSLSHICFPPLLTRSFVMMLDHLCECGQSLHFKILSDSYTLFVMWCNIVSVQSGVVTLPSADNQSIWVSRWISFKAGRFSLLMPQEL